MTGQVHHRAFTLVEALLGIAVLGILAAILVPAVGMSWASARRTKCMAQLSQFGVAFVLHADDHRGLLPFADEIYSLPRGWIQPIDALEPYLNATMPRLDASGEVIVGDPFKCPVDRDWASQHGFSYAYVPTAFMQIMPNPQESVTRMYEWSPRSPVLRDMDGFHRTRPSPGPGLLDLAGRNVLCFDNAVMNADDLGN